MIRPLEYCENKDHVMDSLQTIEQRIAELVELKTVYMAKAAVLGSEIENETPETTLQYAQ